MENTTYVAYVNNGPMGGLEFFGGSRLLAPNGDCLSIMEGEKVETILSDKNCIENARKMRPVLKDMVFEIRLQ